MPAYTKDTRIADIVDAHPAAKQILLDFGLPCYRCVVADHETLAEGLMPHGLEPDVVLARLNQEAAAPESQGDRKGDKKKRREERHDEDHV